MSVRARDVTIRRPCPVRLDPARADGGARSWYCGHCEKSVHVLSNMTESQARSFLAAHEGQDLCVTYAVRRDGSIRFAPEPEPASVRVRDLVPTGALLRRRPTAVAAAAAAAGLSLALAACAPHDNPGVQAQVRVVDTPAHVDRTGPTIPDAPPPVEPVEPDEMLVDGGLRAPTPPPPPEPETLVDGEVDMELIPPRGTVSPRAIPEADPDDEPCDPEATAPTRPKRGGLRVRVPSP